MYSSYHILSVICIAVLCHLNKFWTVPLLANWVIYLGGKSPAVLSKSSYLYTLAANYRCIYTSVTTLLLQLSPPWLHRQHSPPRRKSCVCKLVAKSLRHRGVLIFYATGLISPYVPIKCFLCVGLRIGRHGRHLGDVKLHQHTIFVGSTQPECALKNQCGRR